MQLIVLGMHRSGTSVATRLLNLMGAYFGPEGMSTGASRQNPKGFWERRDVRKINDAVLHSVGCDWHRVQAFDVDRIPAHVVAKFEDHASELVLEMDAHRPWVMKEPRLCLLLPLWRRVLEAPCCIHVLRHPVEVASSLHKRNAIPIPVGLALWEKYVRSSLNAASDLPAVLVSHDALLAHPVDTAERLYRTLVANGVSGIRMPSAREIQAFVDTRLHRETRDRDDLAGFAGAPQVDLFNAIVSGTQSAPLPDLPEMLRIRLQEYESGLPALPATCAFVLPLAKGEIAKVQASDQVPANIPQVKDMIEDDLGPLQASLRCAQAQTRREAQERAHEAFKLTRMLMAREDELTRRQADHEVALGSMDARLGKATGELERVRQQMEGERRSHQRDLRQLEQKVRMLETRLSAAHDQLELQRQLLARPTPGWLSNIRIASRQLLGKLTRTDVMSGPDRAAVDAIRASGLFDETWYLAKHPDVAASGIDPIVHFVRYGAAEGRAAQRRVPGAAH